MKNLSNCAFTFHTRHIRNIMLMHNNLPLATFQNFPFLLLWWLAWKTLCWHSLKWPLRFFPFFRNKTLIQSLFLWPANIFMIRFKGTVVFWLSLWSPTCMYCFHGGRKAGRAVLMKFFLIYKRIKKFQNVNINPFSHKNNLDVVHSQLYILVGFFWWGRFTMS